MNKREGHVVTVCLKLPTGQKGKEKMLLDLIHEVNQFDIKVHVWTRQINSKYISRATCCDVFYFN